jgi:hypothetical protein
MSSELASLIEEIRALEDRVSQELARRRAEAGYVLHRKRVVFEAEIRDRHRLLKTNILHFLRSSPFLTLATAPIIYAMILPLAFLDVCLFVYQRTCFAAWRVPRVRRSEYIVIDRQYLAYLNAIEKLNCIYCGYGNGVIALAREVASRTEQYWCPIKHAREAKGLHNRSLEFLEYGDAEGWRDGLANMRRKLR